MAEGLQIGELPQKENLTGNELIPFQQGSSNGSMSTATLKKYIGTGGGTGGSTDYMNYITEYNVSVQHPTSGIDGSNKYSLKGAITQVPQELRNIGLKVSFINSDGKVETWEFQGGTFTDIDGWIQQIQRTEFSELEKPVQLLDSGFTKGDAIRLTTQQVGAIDPDNPTEILASGSRYWYPVNPGELIVVSGTHSTSVKIGIYAFYKGFDRKKYIGGLKIQESGNQSYNNIIQVPEEANSLCICSATVFANTLKVIASSEDLSELDGKIEDNTSDITVLKKEIRSIDDILIETMTGDELVPSSSTPNYVLIGTTSVYLKDAKTNKYKIQGIKRILVDMQFTNNRDPKKTALQAYRFGKDESLGTGIENTGKPVQFGDTYKGLSILDVPEGANFFMVSQDVQSGDYANVHILLTSSELQSQIDVMTNLELRKYINRRSSERCLPYMASGYNKDANFNMAIASDFHTEIQPLEILAHWVKDSAGAKRFLTLVHAAGDFVTSGGTITKEQYKAKIDQNLACFKDVDVPFLCCQGNHDYNWECADRGGAYLENVLTDAEVREWLYDKLYERLSDEDKNNWHFPDDNPTALYYYYDVPVHKVRIISLNEFEFPRTIVNIEGTGYWKYCGTKRYYSGDLFQKNGYEHYYGFDNYFSEKQLRWLVATLSATPEDYTVVFTRHFVWSNDAGLANSNLALANIVRTFMDKSGGSSSVDTLDDFAAYKVEYDFSARKEAHGICVCGHVHAHSFRKNEALNCYVLTNTCTGVIGNDEVRIPDDVTAVACDILSIGSDKKACSVRYGLVAPVEGSDMDENGNSYTENKIQI